MNNQKMENIKVVNKNIAFDEIHWWQFPLGEFSVKLNKDFKDSFFSKIQYERSKSLEFASYINNQSKKYNKNWNYKRQRALIWEYKTNAKFMVLSAFVNDEGCTGIGVYICSSNIGLLKDIIGIGQTLGYKFNSIIASYPKYYNMRIANHYRATMSASSIENFYFDLTSLYNRFPLLNVGQKYKNLEKWTNVRNRGWAQRKKLETKNIIISLLRNGEKTAYQLGEEAIISVWTTYHHLQQLAKKGQVVKYKKEKKFLYKLA